MKVKRSREHGGENTLFSSLPESPPRHRGELNVSGKWEHHGYLLQAGNLLQSVLLETKSAPNSTLLWYHNGYGLSAATHLNCIVKGKMSNIKFHADKEAIPAISGMPASSLERSHLHFKCLSKAFIQRRTMSSGSQTVTYKLHTKTRYRSKSSCNIVSKKESLFCCSQWPTHSGLSRGTSSGSTSLKLVNWNKQEKKWVNVNCHHGWAHKQCNTQSRKSNLINTKGRKHAGKGFSLPLSCSHNPIIATGESVALLMATSRWLCWKHRTSPLKWKLLFSLSMWVSRLHGFQCVSWCWSKETVALGDKRA